MPSFIAAARWREICGLLEEATDKAEKVAHALEGIVVERYASQLASGSSSPSIRALISSRTRR